MVYEEDEHQIDESRLVKRARGQCRSKRGGAHSHTGRFTLFEKKMVERKAMCIAIETHERVTKTTVRSFELNESASTLMSPTVRDNREYIYVRNLSE